MYAGQAATLLSLYMFIFQCVSTPTGKTIDWSRSQHDTWIPIYKVLWKLEHLIHLCLSSVLAYPFIYQGCTPHTHIGVHQVHNGIYCFLPQSETVPFSCLPFILYGSCDAAVMTWLKSSQLGTWFPYHHFVIGSILIHIWKRAGKDIIYIQSSLGGATTILVSLS